jgi:hypothetical protein
MLHDESNYMRSNSQNFRAFSFNLEESKAVNNFTYIGKQFLFGELIGLGGSFVALFAGTMIHGRGQGYGAIGIGISYMYTGYTIGNSLGVQLAGNNETYKSNYLLTLAGSLIGAYVGVKTFNYYDQKGWGSVALVLGPPVGAILGFNIFRHCCPK